MDAEIMKDPSFLEEAKRVARSKLEGIRKALAINHNVVNVEEYQTLENLVRYQELEEGKIMRRQNRTKWLKLGDASNKYFFAVLKAKQNAERTASLQIDDSNWLEDEEDIVEEVEGFFKDLYKQPDESTSQLRERKEVLEQLQKKVPLGMRTMLIRKPDELKLEAIVNLLAKEKSLGIDGLPVEVLLESWPWTKAACIKLLEMFWQNKRLSKKDVTGVIKLLPKNLEKHLLKNWRPITLLPFTYKIIGKLLAKWLKRVLPLLINDEQTGFVQV
ncbi:hypothetical protein R1sor_004199 [Riccia sorocarpa]|uniref:Reverse transcriptase domain-containing protein n=1 Tax=Riccia sorocarpa TaxID=122646 RepID=A0ABD3H3U3_9MARC